MLSTAKLLKFPMSWNNAIKMLFKIEYRHDKSFGSGIWQQQGTPRSILSYTYTQVSQEVFFFLIFQTTFFKSNGILSGEWLHQWRVKLQYLETILASTIRDRCGVTIKYT
jgi:hypothetical protein